MDYLTFLRTTPRDPIYLITIGYQCLLLYYQQELFQSRVKIIRPFWKKAETMWNVMCTIFSAWGTFFMLPCLYALLFRNELPLIVPESNVVWWAYLYVLTKPLEYIDTIFLMIHNKPIHPYAERALMNYVAPFITWLQIFQFVLALFYTLVFRDTLSNTALAITLLMYTSYVALFIQMYQKRKKNE